MMIASCAMAIAWGCGGSNAPQAPPTGPEAKVSGKVSARGKAVSKGKVTFELTSDFTGKSQRVADVKSDGTYEVSAMVGKNSVIVAGTGNASVEGGYNKKSVEVRTGPNSIDLDLPLRDNR